MEPAKSGELKSTSSISSENKTAQPVSTLEKEMQAARGLFANLGILNEEQKKELHGHIQNSYTEFQQLHKSDPIKAKAALSTLSEIFFLYGAMSYGGKMSKVSQILQMSIMLRMAHTGNLKIDLSDFLGGDKLEDYGTQGDGWMFPHLDHYLLAASSTPEAFAALLASKSERDEEVLQIVKTLKYFDFTLQNIDSRNNKDASLSPTVKAENIRRWKLVYETAIKLCEFLEKNAFQETDRKDALWEHGDIIYNSGRDVHYLENPGDHEGAMATLTFAKDVAKKEGNTTRAIMRFAQIANIWAIHYRDHVIPHEKDEEKLKEYNQKIYELSSEALALSEPIEGKPGSNNFLIAMFRNNMTSTGLKLGHTNYAEMNERVKKAMSFVKLSGNHYYFPLFYMTHARLCIVQEQLEDAVTSLNEVNPYILRNADSGLNDLSTDLSNCYVKLARAHYNKGEASKVGEMIERAKSALLQMKPPKDTSSELDKLLEDIK